MMSNDGKILTTTRWNQSGNIYVSVDGRQTRLAEVYNKYCPNISSTNSSKTVTGCTNTTDSQILYYWLEQGYDFFFSISASDYFVLASDSKTYYCSNTSRVGEGTISQINAILKSSDRIGNGDFIAALNYYCGVKNHSEYGSSTGTTWWSGTYSDGTNAAVFRAAGFDSYYFVSKTSSTKLFSGGAITEVGYSVLRENFDYGEIVSVGIPGHSIYMDGYRYNSSSKQYEYHLNYGWGLSASESKWYTVAQLEALKINYVTIDLTPEIRVNVTSDRGDYYGGSLLRGLERINHAKKSSAIDINFDSSLKGKLITLSEDAKISTSSVAVTYKDVQLVLATTAQYGFSSYSAMTFDMNSGGIISNTSSQGYAIYAYKDQKITLCLDDSFLYAGYWSSGAASVRSLLDVNGAYSWTKFSSSFLASVTGYGIFGRGADDMVELSNQSAFFGKLALGGGKNTLRIGSGSLFYGDITGSSNTLDVTLAVDGNFGDAMMVLQSGSYQTNFLTAVGNTISVTLGDDIVSRRYSLIVGTSDAIRNLSVKVFFGNQSYTLHQGHTAENFFGLVYEGNTIALEVNPGKAEVLSVQASTTSCTRSDVVVQAVYSAASVGRYYSFNGKDWLDYVDGGIVVTHNTDLYFKAVNVLHEESDIVKYSVSCIDKNGPAITITGNPEQWTQNDVVLTAVASDDLSGTVSLEWSKDLKNWTAGNQLTVSENCSVYFRAVDALGNETIRTVYVTRIDKNAPEVSVSGNPADWTRNSVTLKLSPRDPLSGVQSVNYSFDGAKWYSGTSILVSKNQRIYVKVTDAAGNITEKTITVDKIDKNAPEFEISGAPTAFTKENVILYAADLLDDLSGIASVEFCRKGGEWQAGTSFTVTENGTYFCRVTDRAGNVTEKSVEIRHVDQDAPELQISGNAAAPTNQDVILNVNAWDKVSGLQGIYYSFNGTDYLEYSGKVVVAENRDVFFKAVDNVGNEIIRTVTVDQIDKTPPEIPDVHVQSNPTLSNQPGILTISGVEQGAVAQYSFDRYRWYHYSGMVWLNQSGILYVRTMDVAGNVSEEVPFEVKNIDDVADVISTQYIWINQKYLSSDINGQKQNGEELRFNENAFSSFRKAVSVLEEPEGYKFVLLDSKSDFSSGIDFSRIDLVSSGAFTPVIKAGSYSATAKAKGTLNFRKINAENTDFEKFATVSVSAGSDIYRISGGSESSSDSRKETEKKEIVTLSETQKFSSAASGKISISSYSNIREVKNFATVTIACASAEILHNDVHSISETKKTVGGVTDTWSISRKYSPNGKATLTDRASVETIYGFKTVSLTDSTVSGGLIFGDARTETYSLKKGVETMTVTTVRNGSVTAVHSVMGNITGYSTVKLTGSVAGNMTQSAISKTVNGVATEKLTGSVTLVDSSVGDLENFSKVTLTGSSAGALKNVQSVTVSKGTCSILSYTGTAGNDSLSIAANAVLYLGGDVVMKDAKDKFVNNGTLILTDVVDWNGLPLSGKGEIAASHGIRVQMADVAMLNLGDVAEGFRGTRYELADNTEKKAVKWDMKSGINGWMGGEEIDCVDQADFIRFKAAGRDTLELCGFADAAPGCVLLNGKELIADEDGVITASLRAGVDYLLELRWEGGNSMNYTLGLAGL